MSKTWLILDMGNLAHRSLHTTGVLSHSVDGQMFITGVVYGLFRDIAKWRKEYRSNRFVFCFDSPKSLRKQVLPDYKSTREQKRKEYTDEEKKAYADMTIQVNRMRKEYFPEMGYKNILMQSGYEADDLIAAACKAIGEEDKAILMGSDKDLYQLLSKRVSIWNPVSKKSMTREMFKEKYGIKPKQWIRVKAIAGCGTDDVKGVDDVGDITAARYINGELTKGKRFDAIESEKERWEKNISLVKLPYEGCPQIELQEDEFTIDKWNAVVRKLGMKSLVELSAKSGFGFGDLQL